MKLTIDHADFADAVAFVARMSPKRPTQPILAGVLLTATDDDLRLTVYDYETAAETSIIASTKTAGVALVHAGLLSQIASKLPAKPVTLEALDAVLKITCGAVKASMPLMSAEEYPVPGFAAELVAEVSGAVFEDAVQRVAPVVSTEDTVPVLTGVHVTSTPGVLALTATDRYRVAAMEVPCKTGDPAGFIIPGHVLRETAKLLAASTELEIGLTPKGAVTVSGDRGVIMSQIISGKYPHVERLFPRQPESTVRLDREAMADATSRAALAIEAQGAVRYVFSSSECSVSGASGADGKGVSEEFVIDHDGDETAVALRPQFVLDGLAACRAEQVEIWTTHSSNSSKPGPVMFTTGIGSPFRYLLQPNLLVK